MPIDVLLVEDHSVVREALKAFLERGAEFRVVAEADSGLQAIQFAKQHSPDLVLMDLRLRDLNGIEATREILRHCPTAKVVVLSVSDDEASVVNAIEAGALGFVLKRSSPGDLLDAMRTVAKGGSYLGSQVSGLVFRRFKRGRPGSSGNDKVDALSPRERQVLRLIAEGKSSKDIANALALELETVRSYRKTMMKKLGINNAASLTRFAVSAGLTPVESS